MPLGEKLLDRGHLTAEKLAEAFVKVDQSTSLGQVLIANHMVPESVVLQTLAELTSLPVVDLANETIDPSVVSLVPPRMLQGRCLLPLRRENGAIVVATADPLNLSVLDELRLVVDCDVRAVIASPTAIEQLARAEFGLGAGAIDQMIAERGEVVELHEMTGSGQDLELAEDRGLIQFVNQILVQAIRERTSDVHIEPFDKWLRIRYRIDGVLEEKKTPPGTERFAPAIISRIKIMADLDIAEKRLPQDGRIKLRLENREYDVRVSIIPTLTGEDAVLRLLDSEGSSYGLEELGMDGGTYQTWQKLIRQPNGIILVTGPTGSGKSTSLHAALSTINNPEIKIITVEDPVEYHLDGVNQIQVNEKTGLTFSHSLRAILRHDPDIVMVGEIRDLETAEISIRAALTGHLVFSTLHTNDSPSAITRLLDMGLEAFLVSSSVEGVMAQRLVRLICTQCKEPHPRGELERIPPDMPNDIETLYIGRGCEACRGTGYTGRTGIYELMPLNEELRDLVVKESPASALMKQARSSGMRTLRENGWDTLRSGVTSLSEILRVTKAEVL